MQHPLLTLMHCEQTRVAVPGLTQGVVTPHPVSLSWRGDAAVAGCDLTTAASMSNTYLEGHYCANFFKGGLLCLAGLLPAVLLWCWTCSADASTVLETTRALTVRVFSKLFLQSKYQALWLTHSCYCAG